MEHINIISIILNTINIVALVSLFIGWFKGKYTIIDLETWNKVAVFYNENYNKEVPELAGGTGFFRECLYEEDEDYEEEEQEDEEE